MGDGKKMNDKKLYKINIYENDGYNMGEYYLKLTKEELDILRWFLNVTYLENNIYIEEMKEDFFIERGN